MRSLRRAVLQSVVWVATALVVAQGAAAEPTLPNAAIEGVPFAEARALPAQALPLIALQLQDEARAADHARLLRVVGISAHPGSFELLVAYAAHAPVGPVDAATFNAQLSLRHAFGHLATYDDRALHHLLREIALQARDPGWSYRSYRGIRLRHLLRRAALAGLALSGRPEAAAALAAESSRGAERDPELDPEPDPEWSRHRAGLRALHDRVMRLGPDEAFRGREASPR